MFNNQPTASLRLASFESNGIFPQIRKRKKDLSFCLDLIIESRRETIYTAFHFLLYDWQTEVLKYSHTIKRNAELRRKQYTQKAHAYSLRSNAISAMCNLHSIYCIILGHMSNSPISTRTRIDQSGRQYFIIFISAIGDTSHVT